MRLKNKRVIITAAGSGMGRAGCELFAREGASVVAVDIDAARVQEVAQTITAAGGQCTALVADLLDPDACRHFIGEAVERLSGLDVLWNHAGMPGLREVENLDLDGYAKAMDLNVRSAMLATGAAIAHLRRAGGGSVVFTASVAGLVGASVSPVYSAAKSAVVGMAKSFALRYAGERIRFNAVCPGQVETPMLAQFYDPNASAEEAAAAQARTLGAIPLGRVAQPAEIAHAALWLASDDASYVTGVALPVDGGYTAR
jgi:NAD(P)-dependent dehydrogenase (short-subunit alcohol dehydrogenase family)